MNCGVVVVAHVSRLSFVHEKKKTANLEILEAESIVTRT